MQFEDERCLCHASSLIFYVCNPFHLDGAGACLNALSKPSSIKKRQWVSCESHSGAHVGSVKFLALEYWQPPHDILPHFNTIHQRFDRSDHFIVGSPDLLGGISIS